MNSVKTFVASNENGTIIWGQAYWMGESQKNRCGKNTLSNVARRGSCFCWASLVSLVFVPKILGKQKTSKAVYKELAHNKLS